MKHIKLGDLDVSRIGLGAMGMSAAYTGAGTDDAESIRTIHRRWSWASPSSTPQRSYGPFTNEELVGRAIKGHRDEVVLATKFGRISHQRGGARILDSSPANIRTAVEGSLRRLGTDHIDLLLPAPRRPQHARSRTPSGPWPISWPRARSATSACPRPGPPPSAAPTPSTRSLHCSRSTPCGPGTPRHEVLPLTARAGHRLRALLPAGPRLPHREDPLHRAVRRQRLAQDQPALHRRELPVQPRIADEVEAVAAEVRRHAGAGGPGLAAGQGDDIAPIPGTRRVPRVEENTAADGIELTAEQIEQARQPHPGRRQHSRRSGHAADRPLTRPRPAPPRPHPPQIHHRPAPQVLLEHCAGQCPECRVRCSNGRPCIPPGATPRTAVILSPSGRSPGHDGFLRERHVADVRFWA